MDRGAICYRDSEKIPLKKLYLSRNFKGGWGGEEGRGGKEEDGGRASHPKYWGEKVQRP